MHHQGSAFTSTIIAGFESYIEAGVQCADTHAEVLGGAVVVHSTKSTQMPSTDAYDFLGCPSCSLWCFSWNELWWFPLYLTRRRRRLLIHHSSQVLLRQSSQTLAIEVLVQHSRTKSTFVVRQQVLGSRFGHFIYNPWGFSLCLLLTLGPPYGISCS